VRASIPFYAIQSVNNSAKAGVGETAPNEQHDGLPVQHNNHMHITISDPELD
jgi:hypothetical protein